LNATCRGNLPEKYPPHAAQIAASAVTICAAPLSWRALSLTAIFAMLPPVIKFTRAVCASALALCLCTVTEARNRLALVIGNDSYQTVTKLRNAGADADTMAAAFKAAGYTVTIRKDRNLRDFKDDVRDFRAKITRGDEVVFYFSGHGVSLGAATHLLPIDVRDQTEAQVADDSLALNDVLGQFAEAKPALTLAIIDACRDNPFPPKPGRSFTSRGLTPSNSGSTGQMVIYSAGNLQKALDRLSNTDPIKNGVFTRVFAEEMKKPGVMVRDVLFNVRDEVVRLAKTINHDQVPAIYDQVVGQFFFYVGVGGGGRSARTRRQVVSEGPLAVYDDGTVHMYADSVTSTLMFKLCLEGSEYVGDKCVGQVKSYDVGELESAVAAANQARFGGFSNWRVPVSRELDAYLQVAAEYKSAPPDFKNKWRVMFQVGDGSWFSWVFPSRLKWSAAGEHDAGPGFVVERKKRYPLRLVRTLE
jgi:hypothetical protein